MKNWKTTAAGVATIVGGVCAAGLKLYHGQPIDIPVLVGTITAGLGLIHASDSK